MAILILWRCPLRWQVAMFLLNSFIKLNKAVVWKIELSVSAWPIEFPKGQSIGQNLTTWVYGEEVNSTNFWVVRCLSKTLTNWEWSSWTDNESETACSEFFTVGTIMVNFWLGKWSISEMTTGQFYPKTSDSSKFFLHQTSFQQFCLNTLSNQDAIRSLLVSLFVLPQLLVSEGKFLFKLCSEKYFAFSSPIEFWSQMGEGRLNHHHTTTILAWRDGSSRYELLVFYGEPRRWIAASFVPQPRDRADRARARACKSYPW